MTEQQLQEIETSHYRMPVVLALIAEIRRLREQQGRELIARVEAIEQGNGLAQRLIAERDAALVERDALLVRVDQWRQMADREATAHVEMRAERDEARAALDGWVQWASSSRCIYCGQEFTHDPHDQEAADEPKKAHILTCAKHPMAQAQADLTEARRVLRECHEVLANLGYITDDDDPESLCARVAAVLAQEEPS